MKIARSLPVLAILLWSAGLFGQCIPEPPIKITIQDIPRVIECLKSGTANPCWADLLLVDQTQGEDRKYIQLMYRIEAGKTCMDWVLLLNRNVTDKGKVIALAKSLRVPIEELVQNEVKFLRVSGPDAVPFGQAILASVYKLSANSEFILSPMGFAWVPVAP